MPDRSSCSKNRTPPGARGKSGTQSIVLSSSQNTPFLLPVSEVSFFILYAIRTAPESFAGCTCPAADRSRPAASRHPGYWGRVRDSVRTKESGLLTARCDRSGNNAGRVHRNELWHAAIGTGKPGFVGTSVSYPDRRKQGGLMPPLPRHRYFSSVSDTPSTDSFRLTPAVVETRLMTTPFWFFIVSAPAPPARVPSAEAAV